MRVMCRRKIIKELANRSGFYFILTCPPASIITGARMFCAPHPNNVELTCIQHWSLASVRLSNTSVLAEVGF